MTDMNFEGYQRAPGANASGLKAILKSPAHYQAYLRDTKPTTPAQRLGQLTHMAVLEPDRYAKAQVITKKRMGDAARAETEAANLGEELIFVTEQEHSHVRAIADAVYRNSVARRLLAKGEAERNVFWRDEHFQVDCKGRVDFISRPSPDSPGILIDLKTARDVSPVAFSRAVTQYRYDLQIAHYLAAGAATGLYSDEDAFLIAVEPSEPYSCVVYTVSEALRGVGVQWRDEAMSRYKRALDNQSWPSYPEVMELGVNKWAKVPGEEEEGLL